MTSPVDAIVVNFHTPDDLSVFCRSISDEDISSLTIVNNDPGEADLTVAAMWGEALDATVVNHKDNIGYARAVNHAAASLNSPMLAIFNADVIVSPGGVSAMVEFMSDEDDIGIAGPKQVEPAGKITHGGITGSNRHPRLRGWMEHGEGVYTDVLTDCISVSGSAFFVKRACWDELTDCDIYQEACREYTRDDVLGAFLPTRHFYEETACAYHARAHGWKVAYNGQVQMVHLWQRSTPSGAGLSRLATESRDFFRFFCDAHGIVRD